MGYHAQAENKKDQQHKCNVEPHVEPSTSVRMNQRIILGEKGMSSRLQSELFCTRKKKALRQNSPVIKCGEAEIVAGKFSGATPPGKVGTTVLKLDCWTLHHRLGHPRFTNHKNEMELDCLFPCREAHHISALAAPKLSSQAQQNFNLV